MFSRSDTRHHTAELLFNPVAEPLELRLDAPTTGVSQRVHVLEAVDALLCEPLRFERVEGSVEPVRLDPAIVPRFERRLQRLGASLLVVQQNADVPPETAREPLHTPFPDTGGKDPPDRTTGTGSLAIGRLQPTCMSTAESGAITARYEERDGERIVEFESDGRTAAIAQNIEGYAMLKVRPTADGDELERYYGFDMALDHAAELLGVAPGSLPVPEDAADMGM